MQLEEYSPKLLAGGSAIVLSQLLNIVVLSLDDVGWDLWNDAVIPNLSSLQDESIRYPRAYSMPSCSATRYMVQFGQYGRRNPSGPILNIVMKKSPVDASLDQVSLAHIAKARGYRTLHAGKWHLSSAMNYDHSLAPNLHGYDDALAWTHGNLGIQTPAGVETPGDYDRWLRNDNGYEYIETGYATSVVIDQTIAWWSSVSGPKFAHIGLHAPHAPRHAPPAELLPPGVSLGTTAYELTLAMLSAADTEIGRLLAAIDLDDTIVFVMSDNGTEQDISATPDAAKFSTHEGGVNVPFFVHVPGVAPMTSRQLVSLVDLQATIADVIGYEGLRGVDSLSFAHTFGLLASTLPRMDVFAEHANKNGKFTSLKEHERMIETEKFKLILRDTPFGTETFRELYEFDVGTPFVEVPIFDLRKEYRLELLLGAI